MRHALKHQSAPPPACDDAERDRVPQAPTRFGGRGGRSEGAKFDPVPRRRRCHRSCAPCTQWRTCFGDVGASYRQQRHDGEDGTHRVCRSINATQVGKEEMWVTHQGGGLHQSADVQRSSLLGAVNRARDSHHRELPPQRSALLAAAPIGGSPPRKDHPGSERKGAVAPTDGSNLVSAPRGGRVESVHGASVLPAALAGGVV